MRIRRAFALGLLLAFATATAACGEDSTGNDQIATAGGATPSASGSAPAPGSDDEKEQMLKYSQCMRENGVPEFPDPKFEDGGGIGISVPQGADRSKVDAANAKCKTYMPNGGEPPKLDPERLEQLRAYAKCMRENGLPDFPDPSDQGIQIQGGSNNPDYEPDSPKWKAAEAKCKQYAPSAPPGGPRTNTNTEGDS
jgi:hypothetical protein